jgi:RNA-binding protein
MAAKKKKTAAADTDKTSAAEAPVAKAAKPGELTGKQRRKLRAMGHHLNAVVQVGDSGVTDGVIAATAQALEDHELIKIRIADDRDGRAQAVETLAKETGAQVAQELGRTALLFKKRDKKSKIQLD